MLYVSSTLVFITSLFIVRVHWVIVPIIYCLVFFSFDLLHKRAARLLLNADFSQPSVSLFSKLKWLPIFNLIKLRNLYFYSLFLIILILLFVLNVNSTGLHTRACAFNLQVPYPRSNSGKPTTTIYKNITID